MSDNILSEEDCVKILENYFKNSSVKYVSHKIVPISDNSEGFMGEHYGLQIIYKENGEEKTAKLFVKTKPIKNKIQAELVEKSPLYEKEIFLYDYLLKEFEKYGFDTTFAPKSYYCIENKTLVLDDLKVLNYSLHPRHEKFTLEEIKCTLKSLALYHGASFAYEHKKSKELGKKYCLGEEYKEIFQELYFYLYVNEEVANADQFWKGNFLLMDKLIDELPEEEAYKNQFKLMIQEAKFCKTFAQENNLPKTCGHGDLWSNNMMFKYENKAVKKCCLVDYQIIRYNHPSIDVILAIYSNTSAKLRSDHLTELYQYYYDTLSEILDKYGCRISAVMPLEKYYEGLSVFLHEVLAQVFSVNAIVFMPKTVLTESVNKNDNSFEDILFNKEDMAVEAFKNNAVYREVMTESLYDLHDALVIKPE